MQRIDIGKPIEVLGIDLDSEQPDQDDDYLRESMRTKKKTIIISLNDSVDDRSSTSVSVSSLMMDSKKLSVKNEILIERRYYLLYF